MVTISITSAAYEAIKATLSGTSRATELIEGKLVVSVCSVSSPLSSKVAAVRVALGMNTTRIFARHKKGRDSPTKGDPDL